jgi:hypothetical protein
MNTFLLKTVSILSVASAAVLSSLPGLTQSAPANSGTTTGGDSRQQVESTQQGGKPMQQQSGTQSPRGTMQQDGMMQQNGTMQRNSTPATEGATTGGDSRQQVERQQGGSVFQQTPSPRPNTTNSGQPTDDGQRSNVNDGTIRRSNSTTIQQGGVYQQTPSAQPNTTNSGQPTDDGQRTSPQWLSDSGTQWHDWPQLFQQ